MITAAPAPPTRRRSVGTGYYHVMVRVTCCRENVCSVSQCTLPSPAYSPLKCTLLLLPHFLSSVSASRLRQSSAHPGTAADREYAFEMACSNIRYGEGVTREVGMDLENLGVRNVCVLTDKNVRPELCVHSVQLLHPKFLHASAFSLVLFFPPFSYSATLLPCPPHPPIVSPSSHSHPLTLPTFHHHSPPLPYPQLARLPPLQATLDSLHSTSVQYSVYDNVSIEPTNER